MIRPKETPVVPAGPGLSFPAWWVRGVPRGQAAAGGAEPGWVGQKAAAGREENERERKKRRKRKRREVLWFLAPLPNRWKSQRRLAPGQGMWLRKQVGLGVSACPEQQAWEY